MILISGLVQTGFCMNGVKYAKDYQDKDKQAHQGTQNERTGLDKDWHDFKVNADIQIAKNDKRIAEFKVKIKGAKED